MDDVADIDDGTEPVLRVVPPPFGAFAAWTGPCAKCGWPTLLHGPECEVP